MKDTPVLEYPLNIDVSDGLDILDRNISFIQNCDNKASIFLGFFGVFFTIILTTDGITNLVSLINRFFADTTPGSNIYLFLFVASVAIMVFGLFKIICVLFAQLEFPNESLLDVDSKIFFGHIAKNCNYSNYRMKLIGMSKEEYWNDITSQIYINSCICKNKYNLFNCGLKCSLAGFVGFILLWIIGIFLM